MCTYEIYETQIVAPGTCFKTNKERALCLYIESQARGVTQLTITVYKVEIKRTVSIDAQISIPDTINEIL